MELLHCTNCGLPGTHACPGAPIPDVPVFKGRLKKLKALTKASKYNEVKVSFITPTKTVCYATTEDGVHPKHINKEIDWVDGDEFLIDGFVYSASELKRIVVCEEPCNPSTLQSEKQGD